MFIVPSQEGLYGVSSFHGDGTFRAYHCFCLAMHLLVVMKKCQGRTLDDVTLESWMLSDDLMLDTDAVHPASIVDLDYRYCWPIYENVAVISVSLKSSRPNWSALWELENHSLCGAQSKLNP